MVEVFISWSGEPSKTFALALREWLPSVIQQVKPWLSEEDIGKGKGWDEEIHSKLSSTNFGIVVVTPENQEAPWLNFEAGALSKLGPESRVWTVLLGMSKTDLTGPLSRFQHTVPQKEDFRRLVAEINRCLGEAQLPDGRLTHVFDRFWQDIEAALGTLPEVREVPMPSRPLEDVASETLELTRQLLRKVEHLGSQTENNRSVTKRRMQGLPDRDLEIYATIARDRAILLRSLLQEKRRKIAVLEPKAEAAARKDLHDLELQAVAAEEEERALAAVLLADPPS